MASSATSGNVPRMWVNPPEAGKLGLGQGVEVSDDGVEFGAEAGTVVR